VYVHVHVPLMPSYCAAHFSRGMGLGNRLYPWARCHLYARQAGVPMLAPHWWWPPRLGSLLKDPPPIAELPGHLYVRGIRALPEYIGGARRSVIESTSRGKLRVFRGEAGRLNDLQGGEAELLAALRAMSTRTMKVDISYIGVHVRRGDFSAAARTPLAWFASVLRAVRAAVGREVAAFVVSDGKVGALHELLREPAVTLARTGSPLADLLLLAGARVLLASGSSFSAWGAFLGGMPAVTQPQHSLAWFGLRARGYLGQFEPQVGNREFLEAAAAAF
jgi:hypothetical protein